MDSKKVYWIGDNLGQKSALIGKTFYLPGDVIPVDEVEEARLKDWKDRGLVSGGAYSPPVIIRDVETVNRLNEEVTRLKTKLEAMPALENQNMELKADVDRIPGLEREVSDLKASAEKSKTGAKAKSAKAKDARIKELEENAITQSERIKQLEGGSSDRIKELELDNQEKAALIDKLNDDIEKLTAPDEQGAGPGGD